MSEISISVIMPCYNDGQYVEEAIASLQMQSHPDVELIIIDDGSDDPTTKAVLNRVTSKDRVRLLHTHHDGPSFARNTGIQEARGEYILPLDADDRIEHAYLYKAREILEENPKCGAVYCKADLFGEASGPWMLAEYSFERMLVESLVFVTAMFRKADWEAVGGFRTDMKDGLEDYDFFIGILALDKEIVQLPDTLFHYRIKKKSRTTEFVRDGDAVRRAFRSVYEHHQAFYDRHSRLYACLLRDEIVRQRMEYEKLMRMTGWIAKLKRIPILRRIGKKLMGR